MRALSEKLSNGKPQKGKEIKVESLIGLQTLMEDDFKRLEISLVDLEAELLESPIIKSPENLEDLKTSIQTHVIWINSLIESALEISAQLKQGRRLQSGEMA